MVSLFDNMIKRQLKSVLSSTGAGVDNVKVHKGSVHLEDVHFSPPAIEEMLLNELKYPLPIKLEMLYCRELTLVLPWGSWGSGYIEVTVEELSVLVRRRPEAEMAELLDTTRLREAKEAEIAKAMTDMLEIFGAQAKGLVKSESSIGKSFTERSERSERSESDRAEPGEKKVGKMQRMINSAVRKVLGNFRPKALRPDSNLAIA